MTQGQPPAPKDILRQHIKAFNQAIESIERAVQEFRDKVAVLYGPLLVEDDTQDSSENTELSA